MAEVKAQTNVEFVLDHKTLNVIPQGMVGDLAVTRIGTFVTGEDREARKAILKCLYPIISE